MLEATSGLNSKSYYAVCLGANLRQDFQSDLKVLVYAKLGSQMGAQQTELAWEQGRSHCLCILNIWIDDLGWLQYGADGIVPTGSIT